MDDGFGDYAAFPAPAGMNRLRGYGMQSMSGVPRTRGDEPWWRSEAMRLGHAFPAPAGMNRLGA